MGQPGRHDAQLLGVVGDDHAVAERGDKGLGPVARTDEDVLARRKPELPRGVGGNELALGDLRRPHGDGDLLAGLEPGDVAQRAGADPGLERDLCDRRRRGRVALAEGLLQARERRAQLELAEDLAQLGAIGLVRGLGHRVDLDGHVGLDRGQHLGEPRVVGMRGEVLLALGPRDVVDVVEDFLERPEALQQLRGGLVADARDARDVVRRVALQAVEVGDQLRADPVAIDHRLVVVDLRVGDATAGGHHPHARLRVDDLEGVAVAGDDHHRDARPRALAARCWRSRHRPRSRRPARCDSRTPRRAARGAATAPSAGRAASGGSPCSPRRPPCARTSRRPKPRSWASARTRSAASRASTRSRRSCWSGSRWRWRSTPAARRTRGRPASCRRSGRARRARWSPRRSTLAGAVQRTTTAVTTSVRAGVAATSAMSAGSATAADRAERPWRANPVAAPGTFVGIRRDASPRSRTGCRRRSTRRARPIHAARPPTPAPRPRRSAPSRRGSPRSGAASPTGRTRRRNRC